MTEAQARQALREWVAAANPGVDPAQIGDDSPLIERRWLTSLQVADLLVFVEELRRSPVDPAVLRPGVFRSIDAIYAAFLGPVSGPGGRSR